MEMDKVNTGRMKRVLDRVYHPVPPPKPGLPPPPEPGPPIPPPPPVRPGEQACALLESERDLGALLRSLIRKSGQCRRSLQGVLRRCGDRERRLRSLCFLAGGNGGPPPMPGQGGGGVLFSLRRVVELLRKLAEEYNAAAGRTPDKRELYQRFSRECREDASAAERLMERALR